MTADPTFPHCPVCDSPPPFTAHELDMIAQTLGDYVRFMEAAGVDQPELEAKLRRLRVKAASHAFVLVSRDD